jgi:hypothetical protein
MSKKKSVYMVRKQKIWMILLISEVAVLANNNICQLAVADNIRSFLAHYSTFCAISNQQFCLYYILIVVCNITEGKDHPVAQGRQNSPKKERFGVFRADNYPAK